MNKLVFTLVVIIISICYPSYSQMDSMSCRLEAIRIQNLYKKYESKYIEIAKEKLLYYLSRDTVLKEKYLSSDSIKYKRLSIRLIPRFNLDYSARDYKWGDNLCKYFIIDTNNLIISGVLFLDGNRVIFELLPLKTDCDISEFHRKSLSCPITYNETGYTFNQLIYQKTEKCNNYKNRIDSVSSENFYFTFEVLGLGYFIIKDSIIQKDFLDKTKDKMFGERKIQNIEYFVNNALTSKYDPWVRYCASHCPYGGVPWWKFWDWSLFNWRPRLDPYQLEPESNIMFQ